MNLQSIRRAALGAALLASSVSPLVASAANAGSPAHVVVPSGPKIRIVTTAGTIYAVLDPKHAPKSVANFLHYVDTHFFDGGTFFRAIPGFVIQGGNKANETSRGFPPIVLEDPKTTGLPNTDGALAMARTSDPNSATSEFFIDDGVQTSLDGPGGSPGYAVFGHVYNGLGIVRKIVHMPVSGDQLVNPVKIVKIERVR